MAITVQGVQHNTIADAAGALGVRTKIIKGWIASGRVEAPPTLVLEDGGEIAVYPVSYQRKLASLRGRRGQRRKPSGGGGPGGRPPHGSRDSTERRYMLSRPGFGAPTDIRQRLGLGATRADENVMATRSEALKAQKKVINRFGQVAAINGIGITRVGNSFAVRVNVLADATIPPLPKSVDGVPISVRRVGPVVAQAS